MGYWHAIKDCHFMGGKGYDDVWFPSSGVEDSAFGDGWGFLTCFGKSNCAYQNRQHHLQPYSNRRNLLAKWIVGCLT